MSIGELSLQSLAADFAILRAENATLKARADKADARADKSDARADTADARADTADARADKADARADKADARADKSDAENADLKAKVEELIKANSTISTASPPSPEEELMTSYSSRWRELLFIGGTISSAFAVYGYMKDDERWSWAGGTFYAFSAVCLIGAGAGNPQNIQSWKEKLFNGICGVLIGLSLLFIGLKSITVVKHHATVYIGWFAIFLGVSYMIIVPPAFTAINTLYSKLPARQLSNAVKPIFKSLPQILGSTLFISAASTRCLMKADPSNPILKQCGNPTMPSIFVSLFLFFTWFLGYIIPPLISGRKTMTWADVMAIQMSKVEGTQFMLFGTAATITLILFANTDESGGDFNPFLQYLTAGYLTTIVSLLFLVLYEYVVKPLLFPSSASSATSDSDIENANSLNSIDSFNVRDTGALHIGAV
ncbi:hypothetical protein TrST_g7694 [Triparma strigata]|uniref:Uncharacterized protein n=1 Tax=Triparma strigata TaxID=1606541 RepID=A0A9W6ZZM8_9STRA|nr:hypothetical protein TrST_g7694 [Triparma strigata]